MEKIGAVITAAGASSRMGDFKPLMPFEGSTVIQTIIHKLKECGVTEIVIVGGYRFEDILDIARAENVDAVCNEGYATNHMFDSICIGISRICDKTDKAFFWPVDVPGVMISTVKELLRIGQNSDIYSVVPYYNNEPGHPMLIMKNAYEIILSHDGKRGLRGASEKFALTARANIDDPLCVLDIDTQEEYRKLLELEKSFSKDSQSEDKAEDVDFNIHASVKRGSISVSAVLFDLLTQIGKTGNVRRACEETGISLDDAWEMLEKAQSVLGSKLIKTSGREQGASEAELTDEGLKFVRSYDAFSGDIDKYGSGVFEKYFGWIT